MAEENVGGIAVEFVANAEQVKAEIAQLEQRLRQFDRAHGKQRVTLTAQINAPSDREMLGIRRGVSASFEKAGRVQTKIQLIAPSNRDLAQFSSGISRTVSDRPVHVKVIGDFQWGERPPTSITVPVVGGGGGGAAGGAAPRQIVNRPASAIAADPMSRDERHRAQEEYRRRQREEGTQVARPFTGGATGMFGPSRASVPHFSTTGQRGVGAAVVGGMGRRGELSLPARDIYNPYIRGQGGQPATVAKLAASGLTEEDLAGNLRKVLNRASAESIAAGKGWYRQAGALTQSLGHGTGLGRTNVAAATAVFSTQAAWEKNVRNAQNFFDAIRAGAKSLDEVLPYMKRAGGDRPAGREIQTALDVAFAPGEREIEQRFRGPKGEGNAKVGEFWHGLMGDPNAAVIDRHQAMMMSGGLFKNPVNRSAARPFQNALRTVAAERGMTPAEVQGISWATVLGHEVAGADPHGQLSAQAPMGARGYTGEASSLTWAERMRQARPRPLDVAPLRLNTRGAAFAQGIEARPPVDVDPRRLTPFRELDRETSPRLQQRTTDPTAFGKGYLDRLTEDIRQNGMREPVTLEHDEIGQAQITDGNHRLAAALRLGLAKVPVAVKPARGLLTGNTGLAANIPDIIGARGYTNPNESYRDTAYRDAERHEQRQSMRQANEARLAYASMSRKAAASAQARKDFYAPPLEGEELEARNRKMAEALGRPYPAENPGPVVARGFTGGLGSRFGRLTGTNYEPEHARIYGEGGALRPEAAAYGVTPRILEEAARRERVRGEALASVRGPGYGGLTYDPRTGRAIRGTPGRTEGPYVSGVGRTESVPFGEATESRLAKALGDLEARLRPGEQAGVFRDEGTNRVDFDPVRVHETQAEARAFQRSQREQGIAARGAYNLGGTEQDLGVYGTPARDVSRRDFRASLQSKREELVAEAQNTIPVIRRGQTADFPYERAGRGRRQIVNRPREEPQAAEVAEYTPTPPSDAREQEALLRASQGQYGPQAREEAESRLWSPPQRGMRGGKARPGIARVGRPVAERATAADLSEVSLSGVVPGYDPEAESKRGARLIESQQAASTRSLGTYVSGGLSTLFGGAAARELNKEASRANTDAINAHKKLQGAVLTEMRYEKELGQTSGSARKQIIANLGAQREEVQKLSEDYTKAGARADLLAERSRAATSPLRNLTAGLIGQVGAGLAMGAGFAAANAGLSLFGDLAGQAIERATGYTGASNKIITSLADQTRQMHGLVGAATSASFAQSGLGEETAKAIRPALEQRAAIVAGNDAIGEQVDQIRAAIQTQSQMAGGGPVPGIDTSSGGFLNTPFGAQTPLMERLAEMTPGGTAGQRASAAGAGVGIGGAIGGVGGFILGGPVGAVAGAAIGGAIGGGIAASTVQDANIRPGMFDAQGNILSLNPPGAPSRQATGGTAYRGARGATSVASLPAISQADANKIKGLSLELKSLGEAAERATPGITKQAHATLLTADFSERAERAIAATAEVLAQRGVAADQIAGLRAARYAEVDARGNAVSVATSRRLATAEARGSTIPTPSEFYENLRERVIPARRFQAAATGVLQRQQNSAAFGLQQTANPLLAPGSTIPGGLEALRGSSVNVGGITGASIASNITQDRAAYQQDVAAGRKQILDLVGTLGSVAKQAAGADLNRLSGLGQRSAGLQQFIAGAQTGVQTAQYNEQIFQQQRALTDVNQILGRQGATQGDNLGLLERQMIAYQRQGAMIQINTARLGQQSAELGHQNDLLSMQAQGLQLGRSQNQITFQRSLAGFLTPGESPGEMAARQNDAKLQADYDQKQLDIRKEQFEVQKQQVAIGEKQLSQNAAMIELQAKQTPLGFNIEDIGFQRQARDLGAGIDLSKMARDTNIAIAGAQEELAGVQAQIGEVTADLQTYIQEASTLAAGAISDEADAIATLGKDAGGLFAAVSSAYSDAFNRYITGVMESIQQSIKTLSSYRPPTQNYTRTPSGGLAPTRGGYTQGAGYASGGLMDVSSATGIVVGEAGPETIAILRNPRTLPASGGGGLSGGGGTTNVSITINASPGMDPEQIATLVARKVEEIQSRRMSLLGLRGT